MFAAVIFDDQLAVVWNFQDEKFFADPYQPYISSESEKFPQCDVSRVKLFNTSFGTLNKIVLYVSNHNCVLSAGVDVTGQMSTDLFLEPN